MAVFERGQDGSSVGDVRCPIAVVVPDEVEATPFEG